ncbi:MAG: chromosome segregation protein SMC, partial [Clostridia bacterium]|nr:chromosome segregation protein SMC [Clostridia bacterium]
DEAQNQMELAQQGEEKAEAALEEHKAAILEAMNRLSQARNAQTRQQTVKAQMEKRLEELQAGEGELKETEALLTAAFESARELGEKASKEFKGLQEEVNRLDRQVMDLTQQMHQNNDEYQRRLSGRQALQSRLKLMEEMARDFEGYNQAVKKALQYGRGRSDIKGVVAMLLNVPKELETAIDMVLGAALQNIVTEDENAAKDMIHYLRENRLGRATFLPMNTIRGRVLSQEERKVLVMPGCVGLASELVKFAPEYRGIMENLLGRTVVAENLDAGIAIMRAGRHAFRLVTLAGDVMHSGGSMTGGSVQSRSTNLLGREREIKELKENLARLEKELIERKEAMTLHEAQRQEVKRLRDEAISAMHQQEIAVAREQERLGAAQSELESHRLRMEQSTQAQAMLADSLREINEDLERIASQTGSVELDKEAMQEKTAQLQATLSNARQTLDDARQAVTDQMLSHKTLEHEWETLTRDKERLKREITRAREEAASLAEEAAAHREAVENIQAEKTLCEKARMEKEQAVKLAEETVRQLDAQRADSQQKARTLSREMEEIRAANQQEMDKQHRAEIQKTRVESDLKSLEDRIWNTYAKTYAAALEARQEGPFDLPAGERRAGQLRTEIKAMGHVNVAAIDEYAETKARYEDLSTQQQDLKKAEGDLNELIERLLGQMEKQFVSQFQLLKGYFEETFVRLFGGGHAELRLSDPEDALNCGIEVIAQPPGKKLQLLSLLSGGERALTAIAILLAMLKLKPTPFCILDEIEAALDEANVGYFADYLLEYSQNTQFVVVSHRKGTMERCNALYGVAMEERGVSKMVSVNLRDYE